MGFASRMAKDAAAEQAEMFRKELQRAEAAGDSEDEGVQEAPAAPIRNAAAAFGRPASGRPQAFGQSSPAPQATPAQDASSTRRRPTAFGQGLLNGERPQAPAATSRPTSFGGGRAAPPPATASRPLSFRHSPSEHGEPVRARIQSAKHLRLDRLIEEVATFRNASPEDIKKVQQAAEKNPEATLARLQKIYELEVKPFREKNATGIAEARVLHPHDVVFSISVGAKQKIQVFPRAEAQANGLALLDGAHVVSQAAANTPFAPPGELFGPATGIAAPSTTAPAETSRPGPRP